MPSGKMKDTFFIKPPSLTASLSHTDTSLLRLAKLAFRFS